MKEADRYFVDALRKVAASDPAERSDVFELRRVAAWRVLSVLSGPACGYEADEERGQRHRERDYLSWAAEREADKLVRACGVSPEEAYLNALSTRRFLEAFLCLVPLGELERLLEGVALPDYAEEILRNRRKRRSSPSPDFGFDPVTAQIYVRNADTVETLKAFSSLTGKPESAVAKEAVALGARAMAGALGAQMPPEMVAGEAAENARLKEEAADRMAWAAVTLRRNGWTA